MLAQKQEIRKKISNNLTIQNYRNKKGRVIIQYILSLSYGKDSLACLGAIEKLGLPLDRIVHAEVWATDTIPADPPPMVEFKEKADKIIKDRYGIEVEHYCATKVRGVEKDKVTYNDIFYQVLQHGNYAGTIKGFPLQKGPWCQDLKLSATKQSNKMTYEDLFYHVRESGKRKGQIAGFPFIGYPECQKSLKVGALKRAIKEIGNTDDEIIQYLGIAADEPERIERHTKQGVRLPLVEVGWNESYCRKWCEENDLLSPIYTTATRGGCWFCHNQSVQQLRLLRKTYPDYWALLMKWDLDSPVSFKPDGHTVHDFDLRFQMEDEGKIPTDHKFRWSMVRQE